MKKLIVLSVLGLLLGLSGAVAIVVVREKQARAAAPRVVVDSAAAHGDSAQHAAIHGDSAAAGPAHAGEADADTLAADSLHVEAGGGGAYAAAVVEGRDSLVAEVAAATATPGGPDEQRLARIFAAMRPNQAARVLEQMTDPEVRRLLSHLRERQAAAIMSSISPERAAVISSAVIRGERSTP
jgi:hypothetical protein